MRQSTQLIFNTCVIFCRMAIGFVVGLLVTRQLLSELGKIDYGLFLSVGAVWALLHLFTTTLDSSGQRHLAHALGTKDYEAARRTFSCMCVAMFGLASAGVVIGLTMAPLVLGGLDVPTERTFAASVVYYTALVALALMVSSVPMSSALVAAQKFSAMAVFDTVARLITLAAAYGMSQFAGDKLIYWAVAVAIIEISLRVVYAIQVARHLPWARFARREVRWKEIKDIFGFANWMLVGVTAFRMRLQGTLLIFNYFFGNAVAASQGVAMQLAAYQNQLSNALSLVVRPTLAGQSARGDDRGFHRLVLLHSKLTTLASLMITIVVLMHTNTLLNVWLGAANIPPYAVEIVRWTAAMFIANKLSTGFALAMQARGQIAVLVLLTQLPEILFLVPMILFLLAFESEPWIVPASFFFVNVFLVLIVRPIYVCSVIGLPLRDWLKRAVLPVLLVGGMASGLVALLNLLPIADVSRLLLAVAVNSVVLAIGGWTIALASDERQIFRDFVASARGRIARKSKPGQASAAAANPTKGSN